MKALTSISKVFLLQIVLVGIFALLGSYIVINYTALSGIRGYFLATTVVFIVLGITQLKVFDCISKAKEQWQELIDLLKPPYNTTEAVDRVALAIEKYAGDEEMQAFVAHSCVSSIILFYLRDAQAVLENLILELHKKKMSDAIIRIVRAPLQRHFDYSLIRHFTSVPVGGNQIFNPCNASIGKPFFNAIDQAIMIEGENKCEEIGIAAVEYLKDHIAEGSSLVDVVFRVFDNFTLRYEVKMSNELASIVLNGVKYALSKEAEKAILNAQSKETEDGLKAKKVEDPDNKDMTLSLSDVG